MENQEIIPGKRFQFKKGLFKMCTGSHIILEVDQEKKQVYFDKYYYPDKDLSNTVLCSAGFETINIL